MLCPFHTPVDSINPKQKADEKADTPNAGPYVVRSSITSYA